MPTNRWGLGVAVANDSLYAIGGSSDNGLGTNENEQFTPSIPNSTPSPSPTQSLTPSPSIPELGYCAVVFLVIFVTAAVVLIRKRFLGSDSSYFSKKF